MVRVPDDRRGAHPDGRAGTMVAGAVGYGLTPKLAIEGEVSHVFDPADDPDVDSALTTAAASLLYHFGAQRLQPYVAAGLGVGRYALEVTVPPAEVDATALAVNLGAGVTYALNPRLHVRGDFRYFNYTHGTSSDPANLLIVEDVPSAWRFAGAVTVRIPR